jgi:HEAT repeat protein
MLRLQAALRIRPGEGPVAGRLLAMMLVALAGAALGANGVESLFFSRFGPHFLPYLYVGLGVVTFGVMMGMSSLLAGPEPTRRLLAVPLVSSGAVLVARGVLLLDFRWFYPALWVVMMIVWTSQIMAAWGLAGAVHDTRQAKRLFPLYGAGLILGSVVGGLATGPLAAWIGAENLLVAWAGALVAMFLLARSVLRLSPTRLAGRARRVRRRRAGLLRDMAEGFHQVRATPLLRWMSVALVLFAVLYFTLALLFAQAATSRFPRTDELAGFLGLFMGVTNAAALVVSLLVTNRLFARFGVPGMVLALALIYVVGFAALAISATFVGLVAFRFIQMLWVNGVWATGWQALFNVVPSERRARIRSFMDGGPLQAGVVLSGVLLILAERVLAARHLYFAGVGAAVLAAWAMWRARRAYAGALVEALRVGNPDVFHLEEKPFGGTRRDADAHGALLAGASDPDATVRRISVEILAELGIPDATDSLRRALADAEPAVRAAAVRGLPPTGDASLVREIVRLLEDADASVRRAALDALMARSAPVDLRDEIRPLLSDPDPEIAARAAGGLLRSGDPRGRGALLAMADSPEADRRRAALTQLAEAGEEPDRVLAALAEPNPSIRRAVVAVVPKVRPDRAVDLLVESLGDADAGVRDAAAVALAGMGSPAAGRLVEALSRPDVEAGALLALTRLPDVAPGALRPYALGQVTLASRYQGLWRRVVPNGDERLGLVAEALRDRAVHHGLNALRAVMSLGDQAAMEIAVENLASRDPHQRANALETLEAVGEPEIVRPLLAVWESSPGPGAGGHELIVELLRDDDPWVRACAAFAAATTDEARLAPMLEEIARSDADPLVREAAAARKGERGVETLSTLSTMQRVLFLRKVRLFADLSPPDLKQVAEVASEHVYPDGEIIAEQGEAGDEMHILVSGEIRVMLTRDPEPAQEVARRSAGEYVGEMAILSEEPRMASLVSSGDVRTLSIDRRRFERILRDRPDASLAVMRVLCDRLRESHTREPLATRI